MVVKKYYNQIILAGILILSLVLRFSKMFWQRDFWYDEAFTGIITRMSWPKMWWMIFHDVHPPLYYYLLKLWASLFNYSLFSFRSFSVLFGILSVWSIYWIGKKLFSTRVGLISAFLMTISPFAIQYSQEARMYSLFGFLSLWLIYFFIKSLQKNQWLDWLSWSGIGILFFYTHYLALFTFVIFYFTTLTYKLLFQEKFLSSTFNFFIKTKIVFRNIFINKKFVTAIMLISIAFLLWLPALKQHLSREGLGWVPVVYVSEIPQTLQFFFYGHQPGKILKPIPNEFKNINFSLSNELAGNLFDGASLGLIILLIIITGIIALWKQNKYRSQIFILISLSGGVLLFLILLSQIGWRFYVARYFMSVAVLVYLLLGVVIARWRIKWQGIFIAVYILSLLWLRPIPYDTHWANLANNKNLMTENTILITDNPFAYAIARVHLGEGRVKLYNVNNPQKDFSEWIIVKPKDQIVDLQKYLQREDVIFAKDNNCNWGKYQLQSIKKINNLQVCR